MWQHLKIKRSIFKKKRKKMNKNSHSSTCITHHFNSLSIPINSFNWKFTQTDRTTKRKDIKCARRSVVLACSNKEKFPLNSHIIWRNPKKSNTQLLAILTSAWEGTIRQLAESPQVNIKVGGELRSSHNTVQRQERLCATKCSYLPEDWYNI